MSSCVLYNIAVKGRRGVVGEGMLQSLCLTQFVCFCNSFGRKSLLFPQLRWRETSKLKEWNPRMIRMWKLSWRATARNHNEKFQVSFLCNLRCHMFSGRVSCTHDSEIGLPAKLVGEVQDLLWFQVRFVCSLLSFFRHWAFFCHLSNCFLTFFPFVSENDEPQ